MVVESLQVGEHQVGEFVDDGLPWPARSQQRGQSRIYCAERLGRRRADARRKRRCDGLGDGPVRGALKHHRLYGAGRDLLGFVGAMAVRRASAMFLMMPFVSVQCGIFWARRVKVVADDDTLVHGHGPRPQRLERARSVVTAEDLATVGHLLCAQAFAAGHESVGQCGRCVGHWGSPLGSSVLYPERVRLSASVPTLLPDFVWTPSGLQSGWSVDVDANGAIGRVGPGTHGEPLSGRLLLPGFVNVHSHAFQRGLRGAVQWKAEGTDDFWTWRTPMYALASTLDPDGIEALSALCFVEMIESGITTVGEFHYVQHPPEGGRYADPDAMALAVARAAETVGMRIVVLRVGYYRDGPGRPLTPGQLRFADSGPEETLEAVSRLGAAGLRVGLAPHSVRAVSPEQLRQFSGFRGVVHCHVAEQPAEVAAVRAESGCGPLRVLADAGLLGPKTCIIHGTWPDPGDAALLRDAGGALCAIPSTEMDLGDGFLPLSWRDSVRLCVGTDSHARVDLLAEARDVELHARALSGRRNVLATPGRIDVLSEWLLTIASLEGDRALGGDGLGICPGAPADFVTIDLDVPEADGVHPLVFAAFSAGPGHVSDVWVGGRRVVKEGRSVARDAVRQANQGLHRRRAFHAP